MEKMKIVIAKLNGINKGLFTSESQIPKWATSYTVKYIDKKAW